MSEGVIIGVDLGGTNIRAARVGSSSIEGEIIGHKTKKGAAPDEIVRAVADTIHTAAAGNAIRAAGVGVPGTVSESGIVTSGNLDWDGFHFGATLGLLLDPKAVLEVPITVVNDLHATALAEARFGAARQSPVILCVSIGTGIGSKLVIADEVYTGGSGLAGEIGHICLNLGGRQCVCGNAGCLEAYAGGKSIEALYLQETGANRICSEIDAEARDGYSVAQELLDRTSVWLAQGLGIAITLHNPDALVLGGGAWLNCPYLRGLVLKKLPAMTIRQSYERVHVLTSELHHGGKSYAGILGAAVATGVLG